MADPNTRQGKRTPVTLKIKFKSETIEQFIERYAVDVSQGGIFIRTKDPLAVGTQMKFEFQLRDASPLIAGEGTVVWTRENDPSRPAIAPGMGVRFDRLADGSQTVLERILAEKSKQAPQRGHAESTKPPMFTDTPTRVAPMPLPEEKASRDSGNLADKTPLPKPMPFHSDAEEFPEEAFEEATKVRSLDELVAATASIDAKAPVVPVAAPSPKPTNGRADATIPDPAMDSKVVPDRESAQSLPSPPEPVRPAARMLDTTPSPRSEPRPSQPPLTAPPEPKSTMLGVEPAKAPTSTAKESPRAVPAESTRPVKRPSAAPIIILMLVLVAGALAGVWWFVLRDDSAETGKVAAKPGSNATTPGSAVATPGSAVAIETGSGSAVEEVKPVPPTPKGPVVDTVIASSVKGATVEIVGTDQKGPAPFTAKLEKDQPFTARVSAPGYAALELPVKGGQTEKPMAKLVAKPRIISVTTEPAGATIYVDGSSTGHKSPADVELTAAQAARPKVHVQLRMAGYRPVDQTIDAAAWTEEEARMLANVDTKLAVQQVVHVTPTNHGDNTTTTNNNAGSAATTTDAGASGAGSASGGTTTPPSGGDTTGGTTTPPPSGGTTTPPAGGGSASGGTTTPPAGGGSASGGPDPDWTKKSP